MGRKKSPVVLGICTIGEADGEQDGNVKLERDGIERTLATSARTRWDVYSSPKWANELIRCRKLRPASEKPLEPDKKPPATEMFDRRRLLALRRRRPVTLVQGAVTCFDYLAANPFMQL
jgi:hypothetical protein